jgi:hypothetical protein
MAGEKGDGPVAATAAKLRQLADWIACAMFAAVFIIFNYKIFTRYFEHDEAVWAGTRSRSPSIWFTGCSRPRRNAPSRSPAPS